MRNIISTLSLLTTLTLHAQVPSYVPTNGLVGWWPFNGNANDESGNGNNGTVNGPTLTQDRFGNSNSAYDFGGGTDRIIITNPLLSNTSSSYSISIWVRANSNNETGEIICDRSTSNFNYKYRIFRRSDLANQPISFNTVNGDSVSGIIGGTLSQPIWSHVVAVSDIQTNSTSLYFNGQLIDTGSRFYPNQLNATTIGANYSPGSPGYDPSINGKIDDIGIWNRALTPSEIQNLYLAGQPAPPCVSPTTVSFSGLSTSYTTSDGPVTLTGSPTGGVFIGPGVTGSMFAPAVAGEGTHSISYTYLDGNNCVNTFSLCTSVALGMGVEPGGNALGGVRVFPNPNRGQFTVELELNGLVGMQVFDARGALVHNEVFTASGSRTQRTLDLSAFAKGSYTLLVEHNGQRVSQRVVVE